MASASARPTLFVTAGPNGAGKSTFYETVLAPRVKAPFVNADIIQRDELRESSPEASYAAADIADRRRREFLTQGRSFVMATVFSHRSKLGFIKDARTAGFRIVVFHLHLASVEIAVARVHARRTEGGHDVPEHKIRARYERNPKLIRQAALMADNAQVLDSSALNRKPSVLLELAHGRAVNWAEQRPQWFEALYGNLVG